MDSPALHQKLWISEDDTRTSLACPAGQSSCTDAPPGWLDCEDALCDTQLMKRNILTSALHGAAVYAFDLRLGGWFGKPAAAAAAVTVVAASNTSTITSTSTNNTNATTTTAIWNAAASARTAAAKIYNMSADAPLLLQPEIAVFYDDTSFGHLRLNGVGTGLDYVAPGEGMEDLPSIITQTGAPARHYHISDLLLPSRATTFASIKLALFPNAFVLDDELRSAIAAFANDSTKVLLFYYAPGIIDASTGSINVDGVRQLIGCPLLRGAGNHSMQTVFVPVVEEQHRHHQGKDKGKYHGSDGGTGDNDNNRMPNFTTVVGQVYSNTVDSVAGPSAGPSGVLDPWLHLDEGDAATPNTNHSSSSSSSSSSETECVVLGRYVDGNVEGTVPPASLVWSQTRRILFSSAPLPAAAFRLAAQAAGVHLYLDTTTDEQPTVLSGDGVEAAGVALLLRGGASSSGGFSKTVTLPHVAVVNDEGGNVLCKRCTVFNVTLGAGEVKLFYVTVTVP